jgi:hypothetical protein
VSGVCPTRMALVENLMMLVYHVKNEVALQRCG